MTSADSRAAGKARMNYVNDGRAARPHVIAMRILQSKAIMNLLQKWVRLMREGATIHVTIKSGELECEIFVDQN